MRCTPKYRKNTSLVNWRARMCLNCDLDKLHCVWSRYLRVRVILLFCYHVIITLNKLETWTMIKPLLFLIHRVFNTFSGRKDWPFGKFLLMWISFVFSKMMRNPFFWPWKWGVDLYTRSTYARVNTAILLINNIILYIILTHMYVFFPMFSIYYLFNILCFMS